MNWAQFGTAFGALAIGCLLRATVPYVMGGLQTAGEKGWSAWPSFEAKYVTSFLSALVLYAIVLVTVPGAAQALMDLPLVPAVSLGYSGGELVREGVKLAVKRLR